MNIRPLHSALLLVLVWLMLCAPHSYAQDEPRIRAQDGMVMVFVPGGEFVMGTTDAELDAAMSACSDIYTGARDCRHADYHAEQPSHTVTLDGFWIDQTEITNTQFAAFLNAQGNQVAAEEDIPWWEPGAGHRGIVYGHIDEQDGVYAPAAGYEDYPVIEVSWYGAAAYCDWVGGRLPTEAEWEYAARGPESWVYPWGDTFDGTRLNYCDASAASACHGHDSAFDDGYRDLAPVGSYPDGASWAGALDMAGNAWEWVADWWSDSYYAASPLENPPGPDSGTLRIGRGGSWYDPSWHVRAAFRKGLTSSSYRMHWIGFRCVMPPEAGPGV